MTTPKYVRTVRIQPIGGSTAIVEIAGLRLVTDPTLDAPPAAEPDDGMPRRTAPPALSRAQLGRLDAALVSHDQHPDNLDVGGRALLADLPLVLTTKDGAARLGGAARGLHPFEHVDLRGPDGDVVHVTALPARHGPDGAETITGHVLGFLMAGERLPTVYVSGDNASVAVVRDIVARVGPVDVALLFTGGASIPAFFDGAPLTMTNANAVEAARLLEARVVVPIHCEGWTHYAEDSASLTDAFAAAGMNDILSVVPAGDAIEVTEARTLSVANRASPAV
ncbi:MAG: MBL fold metallo-hydrolase [Actinomycetota bacterium]|nr:MBL fold metallo-hydrolase [Actinomycetota bacterium]